MKKLPIVPTGRLIIILLFAVALGCVAGVINGMYNLEQMAQQGQPLPAQAITAMASRAATYGWTAAACIAGAVILLIVDWRKPGSAKAKNGEALKAQTKAAPAP